MADELIVVIPYDPEWPDRFDAERALLERVLAPWLDGGIRHIAATFIPGLVAKPIIDMMAGVCDFDEAAGGVPSRCACSPTSRRLTGRAWRTISRSRHFNSRR